MRCGRAPAIVLVSAAHGLTRRTSGCRRHPLAPATFSAARLLCHLAFGYAGRQASATDIAVNQGPPLPFVALDGTMSDPPHTGQCLTLIVPVNLPPPTGRYLSPGRQMSGDVAEEPQDIKPIVIAGCIPGILARDLLANRISKRRQSAWP